MDKEIKSEWVKIGLCNAIKTTYSNGGSFIYVPEPIFSPILFEEGIKYFEKLDKQKSANNGK